MTVWTHRTRVAVATAAAAVLGVAACSGTPEVRSEVFVAPDAPPPAAGAMTATPAPHDGDLLASTDPATDVVDRAASLTGCTAVGPVPDTLDVDRDFYTQHCDVMGIPVLASAGVDPAAFAAASDIMVAMLGDRPDLAVVMADAGARMAIVDEDLGITDVPEYRWMKDDPEMDWDARSRGFGGNLGNPVGSAGEENLLCLSSDRYLGESIMLHEFAHTVWDMGVVVEDPSMDTRLWGLYQAALDAGLWQDTYAAETVAEYWAEGVQDWFDSNASAEPTDGIHSWVDTREELAEHDPDLHALIEEVFGPSPYRWSCPS